MLRIAFGVILVVALLPSAGSGVLAGGASPSRVSVSAISSGLRITLTVGQRSYPRDALIVARVEVQNVSGKAVVLEATCIKGGQPYAPAIITVIGSNGSELFPPALSGEQSESCPPYAPRTLPSGQRLVHRQVVILRAPTVVAVVMLAQQGGSMRPVSARLVLALTANDAPRLVVRTTPALSATVPGGEQPPWRYKQWVSCSANGRLLSYADSGWRQTSGGKFVPLCINTLEWQLVVGRLNHSVAELDYQSK